MKIREGISALLVVYNEEAVIERCLKSLDGVVDEIIIMHDGDCTDATIEISKKYTDRVYEKPHTGMCELHLIEAIEQASYSWILRLDADEYLSEGLRKNIRQLTKDGSVGGYAFVWPVWDGEKYLTEGFPRKQIFFRKKDCYFIEFSSKPLGTYGELVDVEYRLEHKPKYNNFTLQKVFTKWAKWARVHAQYNLKDDFKTYNCNPEILESFKNKLKKENQFAILILAPCWFVYSFIKSAFYRGFARDIQTWKIPFFQGVYGFLFCLYLSKAKIENEKD